MSIQIGLDVLLQDHLRLLANKRVGLLTNAAGVSHQSSTHLRSNYLILREAGVNLVSLFSPEHGLTAAVADAESVAAGRETRTGLPIHSLYGNILKPTADMLRAIDVLLYDLQDVGVRFYTYTATLALALEACGENGVPLIVLDRPAPINAVTLEGPLLDPALQSFVGRGPLPLRYGLTPGELARFYNQALQPGAELQVIEMRGWRRAMWFDQTGLLWVPTSPAMPHLSTATVYPGMCLLEGTNLCEGRGSALPFEVVGAPWGDGAALAVELNALRLDGVRFRPITFTPSLSKFSGEFCNGVQVHVTDRNALRPVAMGLHIIATIRRLYPSQFVWLAQHFDRLIGDASVRGKIEASEDVATIVGQWHDEQQQFTEARRHSLLYT